jgi:hypothetical protein
MASIRERQDRDREQKLEEIKKQVEAGTLKIRQMTPAERKRHPPRPRKARPGRGGSKA